MQFVRHSCLQDRVRSIAFFPSNTEWIITSSEDRGVRVWDTRTGIWQLILRGPALAVDVSEADNFLATASFDRHVTLWRYEVL